MPRNEERTHVHNTDLGDSRRLALADWFVDIVELHFELPRGSLREGSRRSMRMAEARHLAAYILHTELGLSQAATARALGRHRSTVMNSLRRVEDSRDDPVMNRHIEGLTAQLNGLRAATLGHGIDGEAAR